MASAYGPICCIKGKIPHSVFKQAGNKPAPNPALSRTEGTWRKHQGRITPNTKKALGEKSVGLSALAIHKTAPFLSSIMMGKKMLKFFFTVRPQAEISSLHKMGPWSYCGPLCNLSLGLLLKPSNRNWLTVQRLHTKKAQKIKGFFFLKKGKLMMRYGSTDIAFEAHWPLPPQKCNLGV